MKTPVLVTHIALAASLAGCGSSGHGYVRMTTEHAYVERSGSGPMQVAFYADGQLLGAEGRRTTTEGDWLIDQQDVVDHPNLPRWRRQLDELRRLGGDPEASPADFMRATVGFPFDRAVEAAARDFVAGNDTRAAGLLDHAADLEIYDGFADELAVAALRVPAEDVQVARWIRGLTEEDHEEAVITLTGHSGFGWQSARATLLEIDEYPSRDRLQIYNACARQLCNREDSVNLVVDSIEELRTRDESEATYTLLDGPVHPSVPRQVLRRIDDRYSRDRLRVFQLATEKCHHDEHSHFAIRRALGELLRDDRLDGALSVVDRSDAPEALVVMMVEAAGELPSSDREEFFVRVLRGPHGGSSRVRAACRDTAEHELRSKPYGRVRALID